jgi:hypothetical protein
MATYSIEENYIPFTKNSKFPSITDIENVYDPTYDLKKITVIKPFNPTNYKKIYIIISTIIVVIPISICDIYFALKNKTCSQKKNSIGITLYEYLLVSGCYSLISVTIFLYTNTYKKTCIPIYTGLSPHLQTNLYFTWITTNIMFIISWMILGGFIIWFDFNIIYNNCNSQLLSYLVVQFIMKITYLFYVSWLHLI